MERPEWKQAAASGVGPTTRGACAHGATPGARVGVQVGVWALAGNKLDLPASKWSGLGARQECMSPRVRPREDRATEGFRGVPAVRGTIGSGGLWGQEQLDGVSARVFLSIAATVAGLQTPGFLCPGASTWGGLGPRGHYRADWMPECSCWVDPPCAYIPASRPPSCSAREGSWMRTLVLFLRVLSVSVCVMCVAGCVYVCICGAVHVCLCVRLLGIHAQPRWLVGAGGVELGQPYLCWATGFDTSLAETTNFTVTPA